MLVDDNCMRDLCTLHRQSYVFVEVFVVFMPKNNQKTSLGSDPSNVPALNTAAQMMLLWQG